MQKSNCRKVWYVLGTLLLLPLSTYAVVPLEEAPSKLGVTSPQASPQTSPQASPQAPAVKHRTESIRGRVVWLAEALERRFGIQTVPEARERVLALETEKGRLFPLVEDLRGRSFRTDKRLREIHVQLLVRRHAGSPTVQVIRVHEVRDGEIYIVDYWCDVCAIVMFEQGPCACCQDDNRLRKRLVKE